MAICGQSLLLNSFQGWLLANKYHIVEIRPKIKGKFRAESYEYIDFLFNRGLYCYVTVRFSATTIIIVTKAGEKQFRTPKITWKFPCQWTYYLIEGWSSEIRALFSSQSYPIVRLYTDRDRLYYPLILVSQLTLTVFSTTLLGFIMKL